MPQDIWKSKQNKIVAEVIQVDFDNKRKIDSGEPTSEEATSIDPTPYEKNVGKVFAAPEEQKCDKCDFDKFLVRTPDTINCIRCFQKQDFDPSLVDSSSHEDFSSREADQFGIHPSMISSVCSHCGKTKTNKAAPCSHLNQGECSDCSAISRYLLRTTGGTDWSALARHHIQFHPDPLTGEFYKGKIWT